MSRAPKLQYRLAGFLLLAACSDGTGPGNTLRVLPAVHTIPADSSVQFRAVQVDSDGDTVEVQGAVWSSRDPDIAPVSPSGLVTGLRSGRVTIVALAGDLSGTAEVRVERRFLAKDVSTGAAGLCAVDLEGRIWCEGGWGAAVAYPSVDSTDIRTFYVPVNGAERYTLVGSNKFFACGLSTSAQVLCWGYQPLGDSLSAGIPTPVAPGASFDTLSIQGWRGCGLVGQSASCWGVGMNSVRAVDTGGLPLVRLDVQEFDGCGWTADETQLCWDDSGHAYPGDLRIVQPTAPGVPPLGGLVRGYDFFCGLAEEGLAWCWGGNSRGQLGNGTTADSPVPVQVAGGRRFI
ncbi:MAG TPA: Ig-like domain-containing protein, partial [Gemmatimonadales bacterium]